MTNEEHNKYIAWAFLANGFLQLLILAFVLLIFGAIVFGGPDAGEFPVGMFAVIFGFAGIINLIFLSPNFVAAYGLIKRKPWARIASIVAAAMSAMNVPLGTLSAVYAFWFFCGDQWKSVYPEAAGAGIQPPSQLPAVNETRWEGYTKDEEGAYVYRTPPPPDWR